MSETKWIKLTENEWVDFSFPCKERHHFTRSVVVTCATPDDRHGHIQLIAVEDGVAFIPFCCYSQAGVKAVVEYSRLEQQGWKGILDIEAFKKLPPELTEEEKLIIASPSEMERLAKIWGFWFV